MRILITEAATKSRFNLLMRCFFRYKMCGEFLKYISTTKEMRLYDINDMIQKVKYIKARNPTVNTQS